KSLDLTSAVMRQISGTAKYGSGVKDFEILVSIDGINFQKIYEGEHPNNKDYKSFRYDLVTDKKYKYIRVLIKSAYPDTYDRYIGINKISINTISSRITEGLKISNQFSPDRDVSPEDLSEIDFSSEF